MKERPILFSGAMVRAQLDGSKTQTRRPYKVRKHPDMMCEMAASELVRERPDVIDRICPYGQPGDRLWVRETWGYRCSQTIGKGDSYVWGHTIEYAADGVRRIIESPESDPAGLPHQRPPREGEDRITYEAYLYAYWRANRPSIHMPRWASRITLEVTGVRVERLQDISEADATAEGVDYDPEDCPFSGTRTAVDAYRSLWEQINGAGSWNANPWVWVVEFRRIAS